MLVLKRKEGEWLELTHRSGDVVRIRVYSIDGRGTGRCNLAFDDPDRNFDIQRAERHAPRPAGDDGEDAPPAA